MRNLRFANKCALNLPATESVRHTERAHGPLRAQDCMVLFGLIDTAALLRSATFAGRGYRALALSLSLLPRSGADMLNDVPPSSLAPEQRTGAVHVSYERRDVTSCVLERKEGQVSCKPRLEAVPSETRVRFLPVAPATLDPPKDTRGTVELALDRDTAKTGATVRLAIGVWELAWQGYNRRAEFQIAPDEALKIQLETTAGGCELHAGSCRIVHGAPRQRASISRAAE
jgi:hypothetical protein